MNRVMLLDAMVIIAFGSSMCLSSGAQAALCQSDTVRMHLASSGDVQKLIDAMDCTGNGVFDVVSRGRLHVPGRVEVSDQKKLTVTGNYGSSLIGNIDTNGIFLVSDGSTLAINHMLLEGGISLDGGAVVVTSSSSLHLLDCHFSRNTAIAAEGAIYSNGSQVYIDGTTRFDHNVADIGGAVHALESEVFISGSASFHNNEASRSGGAISLIAPKGLNVSSVAFESNTAGHGAAIHLASSDHGTERVYENCVFNDNSATYGGAIQFNDQSGVDVVINSSFTHNDAYNSGGAIYFVGSLKLFNSNFSGNRAGEEGFAITSGCSHATVEFTNVNFEHNAVYCPVGQYYPHYADEVGNNAFEMDEVSAFHTVCKRCSVDTNETFPGVRAHQATPVCNELPKGTIAQSSGTTVESLFLAVGYYRDSYFSAEISTCYRRRSCVGGAYIERYCATGYEGAYCSACSEGYLPGFGYSCKTCSEGDRRLAIQVASVVVLCVILVAVGIFRHLGTVVDEEIREGFDAPKCFMEEDCAAFLNMLTKGTPFMGIKIVVVVWQIIVQLSAVAEDAYPKEYEEFLSYISFVNFDVLVFMSYTCIFSPDFYGRLQVVTIAPLALLAVLKYTYYVAEFKYRSCPEKLLTVKIRHIMSAALFVAFVVYSSVSSTIFQTFICEKIDGELYLRADFGLSCSSKRHRYNMVYAGVMTVVYPIGMPALFLWWLVRNRTYLKMSDRENVPHLRPLRGIWGTYRPSRYYYEVVECCRRLTLSMSSVFVVPNSVDQISVVLSLAAGFHFLSESLSPFEKSVDVSLYRWGNGIVLASMYVALLMKTNEYNEKSGALSVMGMVLIAANVVMVVSVVIEAVLLGWTLGYFTPRVEQVIPPVRHQVSAHVGGRLSVSLAPRSGNGVGAASEWVLPRLQGNVHPSRLGWQRQCKICRS